MYLHVSRITGKNTITRLCHRIYKWRAFKRCFKNVFSMAICWTIGTSCEKWKSLSNSSRTFDALLHRWHTSWSVCKIMLRYENIWQENEALLKKNLAAFCNSGPSPCRDSIWYRNCTLKGWTKKPQIAATAGVQLENCIFLSSAFHWVVDAIYTDSFTQRHPFLAHKLKQFGFFTTKKLIRRIPHDNIFEQHSWWMLKLLCELRNEHCGLTTHDVRAFATT